MEQLEIILPPGGSGPGVLVIHPWWGRNETVLNYGRRLAGRGFVVGLADAFDGNVVTDREAAQGLLERYWQSAPALLAGNVHTLAAHDAVSGGVNGSASRSAASNCCNCRRSCRSCASSPTTPTARSS